MYVREMDKLQRDKPILKFLLEKAGTGGSTLDNQILQIPVHFDDVIV